MKNHIIILIVMLFWFLNLSAENRISICENRVTHLISKEKITYLQVGSQDLILADIVPEHPNLVRIKATGEFEGECSITLVAKERLYTLLLEYGEGKENAYSLDEFDFKEADLFLGEFMSHKYLLENCRKILAQNKLQGRKLKVIKDGIGLQLRNIYLCNELLFFELGIKNSTNMGYDLEGFKWWIADKKLFRASNVQEYQLEARYQYYNLKFIPAQTNVREIFVMPKLLVPDKRCLRIEMLEKALGNTGRKLILKIENKDILKAKSI